MLRYLLNWRPLRKTVLAASLLVGLNGCGTDVVGPRIIGYETSEEISETLDIESNDLNSIDELLYKDLSPEIVCQEKVYYKDADGDGYPNYSDDSNDFKVICFEEEIPTGYILENMNGWDCDDTRNFVHPSAIEICDYLDNDCDGKIDEGVKIDSWKDKDHDGQGDKTEHSPDDCKILEGYVSNPKDCDDYDKVIYIGALELCDNKDNNCNGTIDEELIQICSTVCEEGYETCENGKWTNCTATNPKTEICDYSDNNCNGETDEGFNVGEICYEGIGECKSEGIGECNENGFTTKCNALAKNPKDEICNNLDDNCNGQIDENLTLTQICGIDIGECNFGTEEKYCINGQYSEWLSCNAVFPTNEICDGLDNDCNGIVDDNFKIGEVCYEGTGECKSEGTLECALDDLSSVCNAIPKEPTTEVCDGLDNNCNEVIDEGNICGTICENNDLVGSWNFNKNSGNTAYDSSNNGLNGNISGASWSEGVLESGLSFDGVDDWVTVPNNSKLNLSNELTLMAWVKKEDSGSPRIICKRNDVGGQGYGYGINGSENKLAVHLYMKDSFYSNNPVPTNKWVHTAVTFNSDLGIVRMYINGKLDAEHNTSSPVTSSGVNLYIGRQGNWPSSIFKGKIDEAKVYSCALWPEQIMEEFKKGKE